MPGAPLSLPTLNDPEAIVRQNLMNDLLEQSFLEQYRVLGQDYFDMLLKRDQLAEEDADFQKALDDEKKKEIEQSRKMSSSPTDMSQQFAPAVANAAMNWLKNLIG